MRTIWLIQPLKSIKLVVVLHPLAFQAYVHIIFRCLYVQPEAVKSTQASELMQR